jgi:methyl halide transferase
MSISLNENYWSNRYLNNQIGWDVGEITTPIKQYLDQVHDQQLAILFPGAGNSYEAAYCHQLGFKNVHILDVAEQPLLNFKNKNPEFPLNNIHHQDFFAHIGTYDLIIEQTFFCALSPELRMNYVKKMHELLKPQGKLVGLLFNKIFENQEPPFGGVKEDYVKYFEPFFKIIKIENCYNSILPRQGNELFIILQKR